jgi:RNA polymerase sigma-70 factor (ECF subfamily)
MPDDDGRAAFDRLVVAQIPSLLRFAIRLCGDPDAAEDLVQEALLRAARTFGTFRGRSTIATWLTRIVINVFRDHVEARRPVCQPEVHPGDLSSDPSRQAQSREFAELVAQCVSRLPPRQREVLVLIAYESFSTRDAAEMLQISEQNVRTNLHLAREKLKEDLSVYVKEPTRER